ncbi:MAG TPA: radical SAM protein [Thermoanaerobaculia bacterium]|nr:radical SAM protein [Thermoanaerobaculia bacterium]
MTQLTLDDMLERERIANRRKHWVRAVTACNSKCIFCLDSHTPRNVIIPEEQVRVEIDRGRRELDADKVILSGGEASLHPAFANLIRYAKAAGYDRVQTVTNGYKFAERSFYEECVDAGLGEITFSLHGDTPELHDRLTQTEGAFERLMKGMIRAVRDGRVIVNVDVVINKQNVAVLDRIVELCISVGVTEFDLLHVIPEAAAFENRDELFYDPTEHLPTLHKVFRLNRHPRYVIWTNRFPIAFLEGLEDLIQDPHKMFDEVNGRRYAIRRYLDTGTPLHCRQQERCVHCFVEPFCTTMDRVIAAQNEETWDVWWVGRGAHDHVLPFGAHLLGIEIDSFDELPAVPSYVKVKDPVPSPGEGAGSLSRTDCVFVADTPQHLEAWLPSDAQIEIHLTRDTAAWMLEHRDALSGNVRIHQPSYEHMTTAAARDVREPRRFFEQLGVRVRVSGLPACLAPGMELHPGLSILRQTMFDADSGRIDIRELARHHITDGYRGKSLRCRECSLDAQCDGIPINMIRDQGLRLAQPIAGAKSTQPPLPRLADGKPPEKTAASLPNFPPAPAFTTPDPLQVIADEQRAARARRRDAERV